MRDMLLVMLLVALALVMATAFDTANAAVDTPGAPSQAPPLDALNFESPADVDVGFRQSCAAETAENVNFDCATMEARSPATNEQYAGELEGLVYHANDLGGNREPVKSDLANLRDHAPL